MLTSIRLDPRIVMASLVVLFWFPKSWSRAIFGEYHKMRLSSDDYAQSKSIDRVL
jgi:hypothetical protein